MCDTPTGQHLPENSDNKLTPVSFLKSTPSSSKQGNDQGKPSGGAATEVGDAGGGVKLKKGWHSGVVDCLEWIQEEDLQDILDDEEMDCGDKMQKGEAKVNNIKAMRDIKRAWQGIDDNCHVISEMIDQVKYGEMLQKAIEDDFAAGSTGGHEHGRHQQQALAKLSKYLDFKEEAIVIDDQEKWLASQAAGMRQVKKIKAREHGLM